MNLIEMLTSAQGGGAMREIAQQFGIDQTQAQQAVEQLAPAISGGLKRNMQSQGGMQSLLSALQGGQHQRYLDEPGRVVQPEAVQDGNAILGHVLGSKEESRNVARQAAQQTGIGESIMKQMLPIVATMVMGSLSKQTPESAMQGVQGQDAAAGGKGLGAFAALFDADGDGSVADDLLGMAGKFFQR